jgi:hypothetical protein
MFKWGVCADRWEGCRSPIQPLGMVRGREGNQGLPACWNPSDKGGLKTSKHHLSPGEGEEGEVNVGDGDMEGKERRGEKGRESRARHRREHRKKVHRESTLPIPMPTLRTSRQCR